MNQLVNVQRFRQSQYDPCYFWKLLSDGTRLDLVMYVDDGYAIDAHSPAADAELRTLNDAFKLTIKPAHFFLGNNITVHVTVPCMTQAEAVLSEVFMLIRLHCVTGGGVARSVTSSARTRSCLRPHERPGVPD